MNFANVLWLLGIVCEAIVCGLLIGRCTWRRLPIFCVYSAWTLFSDLGGMTLLRFFPHRHLSIYVSVNIVDAILQILVLIELAWSVLRPFPAFASKTVFVAVTTTTFLMGVLIWPLTQTQHLGTLSPLGGILVQMQQTDAILRLLLFLLLAGYSQMLAISWRNREMQVATGLGFYSLTSLAVSFLQSHQTSTTRYSQLDQVIVISYFISLIYWIFCFAQEEPERKPFTPQMQKLLFSLAGVARADRSMLSQVPWEAEEKPVPLPPRRGQEAEKE